MELKKIWEKVGFSKQVVGYEEVPSEFSRASGKKQENLSALYVTVNGVDYDAHQEAINNMTAVTGGVQFEYDKLVREGMTATEAYNLTWKQTTPWKGYDNEVHTVQFESLLEAQKLAMQKRGEIYGAL